MTGRQVLASVTAIVLATAVLPPAAAFFVNAQRVARASRDSAGLAGRLPRAAARTGDDVVLFGPGRLPEAPSPDAAPWLNRPRHGLMEDLPGVDLAADPWGNCYLAAGALVLSAGPNGIIDTAFGASRPGGDDVGAQRQ